MIRARQGRGVAVGIGLSLIAIAVSVGTATAAPPKAVVLLVHGLKLKLDAPALVWGTPESRAEGKVAWTGMIGALHRAGWRYGGSIRGQGGSVRLPEGLRADGAEGDACTATLFALEYSAAANVDGVAYQALEVADCVEQLRRFTGCEKVRVVAHSAGGIAVRAYVQGALPRVAFAGDIDRVITIGTPHLGCELAEHVGDFIGPRATSLRPDSEMIRRLNDELSLPAGVCFASIVVRGTSIGNRGLKWNGDKYAAYVDAKSLDALPVDFRLGGDQCVQVCSQNLGLASAARKYQQAASRPVVAVVCRVSDPTPGDWSPLEATVHEVAPSDEAVTREVARLLADDAEAWDSPADERRAFLAESQARSFALGYIEDAAADKHNLSEPSAARLDAFTAAGRRGDTWSFRFDGTSACTPRLLRFVTYTTRVTGTLELTLDKYGCPAGCHVKYDAIVDE